MNIFKRSKLVITFISVQPKEQVVRLWDERNEKHYDFGQALWQKTERCGPGDGNTLKE